MADHIFEPTSFFVVGGVSAEWQAHRLVASMPPQFSGRAGHFTVGQERGLYLVRWDAHCIKGTLPILTLPFKVITPDELIAGATR